MRASCCSKSFRQALFCLARLYFVSPCGPVPHAWALYFGILSSVACSALLRHTGPSLGMPFLFFGMFYTSSPWLRFSYAAHYMLAKTANARRRSMSATQQVTHGSWSESLARASFRTDFSGHCYACGFGLGPYGYTLSP